MPFLLHGIGRAAEADQLLIGQDTGLRELDCRVAAVAGGHTDVGVVNEGEQLHFLAILLD